MDDTVTATAGPRLWLRVGCRVILIGLAALSVLYLGRVRVQFFYQGF